MAKNFGLLADFCLIIPTPIFMRMTHTKFKIIQGSIMKKSLFKTFKAILKNLRISRFFKGRGNHMWIQMRENDYLNIF